MREHSAAVIWSAAILTSALGATVLFSASPGINWPIWVAVAAISVLVSRIVSGKRIEAPLAVLLTWATLLSFGLAVTDNDFIQFLVIIADAMLLGLAIIIVGAERWSALSASLIPTVPFLAPFRVWRATAYEAADAPGTISSPRARSIIKGTLLSVPLVLVLIALLGSADPVIRWVTDRLSAWLPDWSWPPRVVFFVFLMSITVGANSISARQLEANLPKLARLSRTFTVGLTEQRMMLWSAAVVLWIFVLLQVSYFIHPPPTAIDSGVTFAEYARRGFGELSFAATIVGAIILVLEYARPADATDADRNILRRLELSLVIALEFVLLSAFRRVILYEQAYGFTTARLFAQAYMVVICAALIVLAVEIWRGSVSIAFGRRVAEIALAVFTILVFWNYEAWIVNRNVDRAVRTGKFDPLYAGRLSRDATPTLVERRAQIPAPEREIIDDRLACKPRLADRRWFEFNWSVAAATRALRGDGAPTCLHPEQFRRVPRRARLDTIQIRTTRPPPLGAASGRAASSTPEE